MKKPDDLIQLLEELETSTGDSSVETEHGSHAVIHTEYSTDASGLTLNERECKLLLNTEDSVEQLFDALGRPVEATVTLHNLVLEDDVLAALERNFAAVDEA